MNRRRFLTIVGGGTVLAATAATTGFLTTRTPHKALQPWHDAGILYDEPRRKALSYALLAPNPHNRQPWQVDLSKPNELTLYADTERLLPHTDPFGRQITIGLGCFLELMVMAAAVDGNKVELQLFSQGFDNSVIDERPVARAIFTEDKGLTADPLFRFVKERRSNKEPYDTSKPVAEADLEPIQRSVRNGGTFGSSLDSGHIAKLRKLTSEALMIEIETPHTYKESVDLFRIGRAEIEQNPDGIDFSGPFFESLALAGLFNREVVMDTSSTSYKQGIAAQMDTTNSAMGHVWLTSAGNTRIDQIKAGRDWVRLNLAATMQGIAMQPLSQALQEYPEMAGHFQKVHKMLAPEGDTVQMLARIGYGQSISESPRWGLETRIMKV
ncbi:MAG: twin-arginine translocation pathway signal protein [Pseudomonadota bacterium]